MLYLTEVLRLKESDIEVTVERSDYSKYNIIKFDITKIYNFKILKTSLEIYNLLNKKCISFLREIKKNKKFVYRQIRKTINEYEIINSRLDNRKPKDMPLSIHNHLNRVFKNKFGWNVRNGVFAAMDISTTKGNYGNTYLFFPIGDYSYVWSPDIDDLYTCLGEPSTFNDFNEIEFSEVLLDTYVKDIGLDRVRKEYELIFNCKTYFMVNIKYKSTLEKMIFK